MSECIANFCHPQNCHECKYSNAEIEKLELLRPFTPQNEDWKDSFLCCRDVFCTYNVEDFHFGCSSNNGPSCENVNCCQGDRCNLDLAKPLSKLNLIIFSVLLVILLITALALIVAILSKQFKKYRKTRYEGSFTAFLLGKIKNRTLDRSLRGSFGSASKCVMLSDVDANKVQVFSPSGPFIMVPSQTLNKTNPISATSSSSTAYSRMTNSTILGPSISASNSLTKDPTDFPGSSSQKISLLDDMTCSGSGSGNPLLIERTAARQVQLQEIIGEGRFGEVWRGTWQCDQVAAKIFSSRDERSWAREVQIYETIMLRHPNILGYIASDNRDTGLSTELWLITEYHSLGSLYDFFVDGHYLTPAAMIKMASSVINGLAHLHLPIVGMKGKPAIAHRDLKSRNILVKNDGECCIGDLGFAVKYDASANSVDVPDTERIGTKRYMSPEVLMSSKYPNNSIEFYLRSDMYSCSLVLWEISTAGGLPEVDFYPSTYQIPYHGLVSNDPSFEEMLQIVVEEKRRPDLVPVPRRTKPSGDSPEPGYIQAIKLMNKIIQECWYEDPLARLNVMRVKKYLNEVKCRILNESENFWNMSGQAQQPNALEKLPFGVYTSSAFSKTATSGPT